MTPVSFRQWLTLDPEAQGVVLDQVLERLPEGYVPATDLGHARAAVPQFLHRTSGVLFSLLFGDEVLLGMSQARFERALAVGRAAPGDDEDLPVPVLTIDAAAAVRPARTVVVPPVLVGEVLAGAQLQKLGVPAEQLAPWGIRRTGLTATLKALVHAGWRLPSEAEWEFACRAAMDSLDDLACPVKAAMRCLPDLGARAELCRDDWHPSWVGAPVDASSWGEGHELLRGGGGSPGFAWWTATPAWAECVWPMRHPVSGSSRTIPAIAMRPWLSLLR